MKKALFPGTFDPPTLGHLDIIERAAKLFEKLYIGILKNNSKGSFAFTADEKVGLMRCATTHLQNVEIIAFTGLTVECAKTLDADVVIRGVRNCSDFEYESQMASANRTLADIETMLMVSAPKYIHCSATLIREIAKNGQRLTGFVPEIIEEAIFQRLSQNR